MTAVAYLRVSSIKDQQRAISPEQQEAAVRSLAAQHGDDPAQLRILRDWNRSGGRRMAERGAGSRELVRLIEAGQVRSLYCYSSSRLGRNLADALLLIDLANSHGVEEMWSYSDGNLNPKTASGKFTRNVLASAAQFQRDEAVERGQANLAYRIQRGDTIGLAPFGQKIDPVTHKAVPNPEEDVAAVVAAYRSAGSVLGAAHELNRLGVHARHGKWADQTVGRILRREGIIPSGGNGRTLAKLEHYLHRLLVCPHCQTVLTPSRKQGRPEWTVYVCQSARRDKDHPRPYSISERLILPWVKSEAARFRPPQGRVAVGDPSTARSVLEAEREDLGDKLLARLWSPEKISARVDAIDAELAVLGGAEMAADVPAGIDWQQWTRGDVNGALRTYWDHVALDAAMLPVSAAWRLPVEYLRP